MTKTKKHIMVANDIDDGGGGSDTMTCRVEKTKLVVDSTDHGGNDSCDGDNGGTLTCEEEITEVVLEVDHGDAMKLTDIKIELDDDINGNGGGGGSLSLSSSTVSPKSMKKLGRTNPPPFLEHTFKMVEDPETDPIISWSLAGNSFIIWDSLEFSNNLLLIYFKHNNFSSFIRQLNLYGFKKIDSERWEFTNEGFQRGKKHLLKNIKRRYDARSMQQKRARTCVETEKFKLQTQLQTLNNDHDILKHEILKIRQQEETSQNHLAAFEEYIQCVEYKHNEMITFLAKSIKNPTFVQQLIQQEKLKAEQNGSKMGEKHKLIVSQSNENLLINQVQEEQVTAIQTMFYAAMDDEESGSCIQNKKAKAICETSNPNLRAVNDMKWQKLLEEVLMGENEAEETLAGNHSKIFLEFEDLMRMGDM